jgi:CheY-like chemotaxis protein
MENPLETTELPRPEDWADVGKKERLILVAEDSPDSAIPISLHLQQSGYSVVMANDGLEAVRVAALSRPNLILMDLAMPELDGLAATKKIREESTSQYIPIIAVTAFSTSGFLQAAHDVGFDGYLTKPIDFERMDDLIKTLLGV